MYDINNFTNLALAYASEKWMTEGHDVYFVFFIFYPRLNFPGIAFLSGRPIFTLFNVL